MAKYKQAFLFAKPGHFQTEMNNVEEYSYLFFDECISFFCSIKESGLGFLLDIIDLKAISLSNSFKVSESSSWTFCIIMCFVVLIWK